MGAALDLGGLSRVVSFLRRGLTSTDDTEEAFDLLLGMFQASSVVLAEGWEAPVWHLARGVPEAWIRDHTRLSHEDPSRRLLIDAPAGTWWCAERDATAAERRTELWHCFGAAGLRDAAVVRVYNPFRDNLVFAMYRDDRAFQPRELEALEILYPHLAGAAATRRAAKLVDGAPESCPPSVEVRFPGGQVALDAAARRVVSRHVHATSADGWARVERAIVAAARCFTVSGVGGRSQVLWPRLRVDFAVVPPGPGDTVRLLGFLIAEDQPAHGPVPEGAVPAMVAAVLSPRQLAVARDFAAGMTLATIAEERRIGLESAKSHLRAAYEKLGVTCRAELARALRNEV